MIVSALINVKIYKPTHASIVFTKFGNPLPLNYYMNILTLLDAFIGLIVIYLTLALACTVINEWIDATLHVRAGQLRNSIAKMLSTTDNESLWNDFYEHPLIKGLVRNTRFLGIIIRKDKPTYISTITFRRVLMDILKKLVNGEQTDTTTSFTQTESLLKNLPNSTVKQRLLTILENVKLNTDNAAKRLEAFQAALDQWFNECLWSVLQIGTNAAYNYGHFFRE